MAPHPPGRRWVVRAREGEALIEIRDRGVLDEVVIESWFHLEKMDDTTYWMRIHDTRVMVYLQAEGPPHVTIEPGFHDETR